MGQQVLRAACAQARDWQGLCAHPLRMAVNVSARQLREPGLVDDVADALRETGLEPGLLEIEITETATLSSAGHADAVLHRLREMGVSVSLDDFGTGYSSLSQLRRLPIDRLKIDRSFVAELPGNESSAAIAGAVIDLAHAMGLGVVAEGVETRQQLEFLQRARLSRGAGIPVLPAAARRGVPRECSRRGPGRSPDQAQSCADVRLPDRRVHAASRAGALPRGCRAPATSLTSDMVQGRRDDSWGADPRARVRRTCTVFIDW